MVHPLASNLIVKLLRGMFKQRPSVPRYIVTYDVVKVLQYISNSYSNISFEFLTKNLAAYVHFKRTKIPNYELIKIPTICIKIKNTVSFT